MKPEWLLSFTNEKNTLQFTCMEKDSKLPEFKQLISQNHVIYTVQ